MCPQRYIRTLYLTCTSRLRFSRRGNKQGGLSRCLLPHCLLYERQFFTYEGRRLLAAVPIRTRSCPHVPERLSPTMGIQTFWNNEQAAKGSHFKILFVRLVCSFAAVHWIRNTKCSFGCRSTTFQARFLTYHSSVPKEHCGDQENKTGLLPYRLRRISQISAPSESVGFPFRSEPLRSDKDAQPQKAPTQLCRPSCPLFLPWSLNTTFFCLPNAASELLQAVRSVCRARDRHSRACCRATEQICRSPMCGRWRNRARAVPKWAVVRACPLRRR